jgi:hypothetical protein
MPEMRMERINLKDSALAPLQEFIAGEVYRAWVPPFRGRITEYAETIDLKENVFAVQGFIKLYTLRHLIEPLEALYDPSVRLVSVMGAVQTTKSLLPDMWVPYLIEHDPGPILWLLETDPKAKKYADERAMPLIRSIPNIYRMLQDVDLRHKTMTRIKFAQCTLTIAGLNETNVQTFPYRYVIIDEAWMARDNGLIRQAIDRTRQYADTCKVLILGQGGWDGHDHDTIHKQTDDRVLEYACPFCGFHQPFELTRERGDEFQNAELRGTYSGLSWDNNERTRVKDRWNLATVGDTAHYRCFQCDGRIEDTHDMRLKLMASYTYRATNLKAEPGKVGFRWTSEASPRLRFRDQVTKYLRAKMMMQEQGYDLPMQEFYQKDRGLSWSPTAERDAFVITSDDYNPNAEWPDEKYRFLIVDCQKELKKFYAGVFSVSMAGEIRERYRGEAQSWEELREIQRKHEVKDQRVFVDCGYSMSKVLRQCVQFKHEGWITIGGRKQKHWLCWTGLKGSGREIFQVHNPRTKLMESKIHSVRKFYDVSEGTNLRLPRAPYYEWSNLHCKDLLFARLEGTPGLPKLYTLPDTLPADDPWSWTMQVRSEHKVDRGNNRPIYELVAESRPNHELDKLAMLFAVMGICGIIGGVNQDEDQEQAA